MEILLDGRRFTHRRNRGGVTAFWRALVPSLLATRSAAVQPHFRVLSAHPLPWRARPLAPLARAGASLHHHWAPPSLLAGLGRIGLRTEWLGPGRVDILHLSHPGWFLPTRARLVVSVQGLLHHHHPQLFHPKQVKRLEDGFRGMAEAASYWLCTSEGTREDLISSYRVPRGRTEVIYPGTSPAFAAARVDAARIEAVAGSYGLTSRPYHLFLGRVEPRKNLKNLVDAFELALSQDFGADLAIAGPYGWKAEGILRACHARPRLRGRLHFLGFVPDEDLPYLMAGAEAFVHPARHEGSGMTALEALAAGTPALCSNRGALPEVTGGAALLFEPNDPASICGAMVQAHSDQALRQDLRQRGLRRSAGFRWERCAELTIAAYQRAMELPR